MIILVMGKFSIQTLWDLVNVCGISLGLPLCFWVCRDYEAVPYGTLTRGVPEPGAFE